MKKLEKLKLNQLRKIELEQREMNALKGGCGCSDRCPCGGYDEEHTNHSSHTATVYVYSY
jgi:natural product precursor